jgi:hypothetical protein
VIVTETAVAENPVTGLGDAVTVENVAKVAEVE